jgi:hypothetical protein
MTKPFAQFHRMVGLANFPKKEFAGPTPVKKWPAWIAARSKNRYG